MNGPSGARQGKGRTPRRYLALWFPYLATERLGRAAPDKAGAPVVVAGRERGTLRLTAVDPRAAGLGLEPGMGLAQARARVPRLAVAVADPDADMRLLSRLAEACEVYAPRLALDLPQGLILDITGCAHLFGGEAGMLARLPLRIGHFGVSTRMAFAGTPEAARAFARFGPGGIVAPGDEARAARRLPVRALEAGARTHEALIRAGLLTLGDLADRPSQVLSARFDPAAVTRLQRILGREDARITPLRPRPDFSAEEHFADPFVATEALYRTIDHLAARLGTSLAAAGRGGRSFELTLFRSDGALRRLAVETAVPMREAEAMARLLRLRVEGLADPLDPGFGFDAVRLAALSSEPVAAAQPDLEGRGKGGGRPISELIDRLVTRFGRDRVLRFVARDSHDPMRAGPPVPWLSPVSSDPWPATEGGEPPCRPLTIFDPPQPVEAMAEVPDGPPVRFRWRRVLHEVVHAEGPERIAPEWWRRFGADVPSARDYYRVEDRAGRRFWMCREGGYGEGAQAPRWYVTGLFG